MEISSVESSILLKLWSICVNDNDEIFIGLLYSITSKNYLWKSINSLIKKECLGFFMNGRKKYVFFTTKGLRITKALKTIKDY